MKKINEHTHLISSKFSRNRIVMPPMDTLMATNGIANDFHIQHYGSRAYGGVGTIILESTAVSVEGRIREKDLGLWSNKHIKPMKKVASIVKKAGAVVGVQLNHAGAKAELNIPTIGTTKYFNYLDQEKLSIATLKDLQRIENDFVKAAVRAKKAGFDFVEIHAAHGYLLNQMYHPLLNEVIKSDDILKRAKMIINIAKRIKTEAKIDAGIRFSVLDDVKEEMIKISDLKPLIEKLEPYIEYIHISSGSSIAVGNDKNSLAKNGTKLFRIAYAKEVQKFSKKPLIVVGNFQDRVDVDKALKENIDFIAIGRELLFNPNLVVTNILNANEMNQEDYHWNENHWWNATAYKIMLETINKK